MSEEKKSVYPLPGDTAEDNFSPASVRREFSVSPLAYLQTQCCLAESGERPEWSFVRLMPVNELQAFGLDASGRYILAVGSEGREVLSLRDGQSLAKDAPGIFSGKIEREIDGLGPIPGRVKLWGPKAGQASKELLREARKISNGLSKLITAATAADGRLMLLGQEDGIYIFERL